MAPLFRPQTSIPSRNIARGFVRIGPFVGVLLVGAAGCAATNEGSRATLKEPAPPANADVETGTPRTPGDPDRRSARSSDAAAARPAPGPRVTVMGEKGRQFVAVNGRRLYPADPEARSQILGALTWSPAGFRVGLIERLGDGTTQLVVITKPARRPTIAVWRLPQLSREELKIWWAGDQRLTVGKDLLNPRLSVELDDAVEPLVSMEELRVPAL